VSNAVTVKSVGIFADFLIKSFAFRGLGISEYFSRKLVGPVSEAIHLISMFGVIGPVDGPVERHSG